MVSICPVEHHSTGLWHRITDFTESVNTVLSEKRPWSEWLRSAPIVVEACSP